MAEVRMVYAVELIANGVTGGNNATVFNFPDQPYLNDKPVDWLSFYTIGDLTVSPSGTALVAASVVSTAYLTLYTTNPDKTASQGQWIYQVPLWDLHYLQNSDGDTFRRDVFQLVGQKIVWTKSFITLGTPMANTGNVSFFFNVGYWDPMPNNTLQG